MMQCEPIIACTKLLPSFDEHGVLQPGGSVCFAVDAAVVRFMQQKYNWNHCRGIFGREFYDHTHCCQSSEL
jgi:hypothetical protein